MLLKDIMSPNVESVSVDSPLSEAARKMASFNVGFLPVIDSEKVVGVITDRDIVIRGIAEGHDPQHTPAKTVMSQDVETLSEDLDIHEAAKRMEEKQIRRILVTDSHGRYVGVVSLGDLAAKSHDEPLSGEVIERVSEPSHPMQ